MAKTKNLDNDIIQLLEGGRIDDEYDDETTDNNKKDLATTQFTDKFYYVSQIVQE